MISQKNTLVIYIISLLFLTCISCNRQDTFVRTEGMIWNTVYHITYKGDKSLQDSLLPVFNEVNKSLSVFEKTSLVSQINEMDSLVVNEHFITVYDASKRINRLSKGMFDPTVSPLIEAWGFGQKHTASQDTAAIDSILMFVGIDKTRREGNQIIKEDKRIKFNFSAIAKGYGVEAVAEMFQRNGVTDYMVEIGGELSLSGNSPTGKTWNIAVDTPIDDGKPGENTAMILSLTGVGIATSGNYRNYRIEEGNKVVHTISPVTGHPVIGEILSATIIAPTCMEADAIATACMASTTTEAKQLLKECNVEGLFIFSDSIWMTPGFKKYIISEVSEPGRKDRN